ncbi:MAG: hypothetical protein ABL931_02160 [Usitatibacteraceae bacterium]
MAFFGLSEFFGNRKKGYSTPWSQLTVVYATAPDGLQPEDAFALRGKILTSHPIDFEFLNTGSFLAYYAGTPAGLDAGTQLGAALRSIAHERAVCPFGVGVHKGECLAQLNAAGRLVAKPAGLAITEAMKLARLDAGAASN